MALAHRVVAQILHEREIDRHLRHDLDEPLVDVPLHGLARQHLDLLLKLLRLVDHDVGVHARPERVLVRGENLEHELHVVPHHLEELKALAALANLAEVYRLHLEQLHLGAELLRLGLDLVEQHVPLVEQGVRRVRADAEAEGRLRLEARDKVDHLLLEGLDLVLDLLLLHGLQRMEHLARVERRLLGVLPLEGRLLEALQDGVAHRDVVLLEQRNGVLDRLEHGVELALLHAHVVHVRHGRDQRLRIVVLGRLGEAAVDLVAEAHQVLQLALNVVLEVVGVRQPPLGRPGGERVLHWPRIHLEPALEGLRWQRADLVLDSLVVDNPLVEEAEVDHLGTRRALLGVRSCRRIAPVSWGSGAALLQPALQLSLDVLEPQLLVCNERLGELVAGGRGRLNFGVDAVDVEAHLLVLLHLLDKVTLLPVEPLHELDNVVKVGHPAVDVASDRLAVSNWLAISARVAAPAAGDAVERRREAHLKRVAVPELKLHLEQWRVVRLRKDGRVNEGQHKLERGDDRCGDAVDEHAVDELDVRAPRRRALRHFEDLVRIEQQLVDLLAAVGDLFVANVQLLSVLVHKDVGDVGLCGAAHEQRRVGPLLQHRLHALHVGLEGREDAVRVSDQSAQLVDKGALLHLWRLPLEVGEPPLHELVDVLHVTLQQRPLHLEQAAQHPVVVAAHQLQAAGLHAEELRLFIQFHSHAGHVLLLNHKVLDLV
mmetsp:Transcript_13830/g.40648  ORF Transcript_13830/g.40648 Transcript_13830/m.40648 type:complete len:713 (+) Transcript_13830:1624-3762(+)